MSVNPGDILAGKYRVERVLGAGGMGVVVAATHLALGQIVALKFMLPEALGAQDAMERFLREARAAGKLRSEHVAAVKDVGMLENGAPYISMEYLEGLDLAALVAQRGGLPPVEAIDYMLQACEALAEAHAHGIVHRDLKPANLFLTRRPNGTPLIKVLDFGISKMQQPDNQHMTRTQAVMGSPLYMSPEQVRSTRSADARSDVWSLGVVLYELMSSRTPFAGESFTDICVRIAVEPPQPFHAGRLPVELEGVIMRCLQKDPALRYQSVAELAMGLAPFGPADATYRARNIAHTLGVTLGTEPMSVHGHATHQHQTGSNLSGELRSGPRGRKLPLILGGAVIAIGIIVGVAVGLNHGTSTPTAVAPAPEATPPVSAPVSSAPPVVVASSSAPAVVPVAAPVSSAAPVAPVAPVVVAATPAPPDAGVVTSKPRVATTSSKPHVSTVTSRPAVVVPSSAPAVVVPVSAPAKSQAVDDMDIRK